MQVILLVYHWSESVGGHQTSTLAGLEDNRQCGQSSVRTIASADNCHCGQLSGGHLSGRTFVQENYFKTYHVGYRWKGLDCNIVNLPFILVVDKFKIKRKTKICKKLIFDKLSLF